MKAPLRSRARHNWVPAWWRTLPAAPGCKGPAAAAGRHPAELHMLALMEKEESSNFRDGRIINAGGAEKGKGPLDISVPL